MRRTRALCTLQLQNMWLSNGWFRRGRAGRYSFLVSPHPFFWLEICFLLGELSVVNGKIWGGAYLPVFSARKWFRGALRQVLRGRFCRNIQMYPVLSPSA